MKKDWVDKSFKRILGNVLIFIKKLLDLWIMYDFQREVDGKTIFLRPVTEIWKKHTILYDED